MTAKLENEYGIITIDYEVIARIAGYAALDCYGIVGMAAKNVKDGLVQLLKLESLTKGIKMTINENFLLFIQVSISGISILKNNYEKFKLINIHLS